MKRMLVAVLAILFFAGTVLAIPVNRPDGGTALDLQDVFNDITVGGDSSVNVFTDYVSDSADSYWGIGGSGGSISTMIIELAGFASNNKFGIYGSNGVYVELFDGSATAGSQVGLSILANGDVNINFVPTGQNIGGTNFGYYLDSRYYSSGGLFHSDSDMNESGVDHMFAYQGVGDEVQIPPYAAGSWGSNEYILAFEDLYGGGDFDYTDMVVMVESVSPVPEPATLLLLGSGLVGLAFLKRRKS